MYLKYKLLDHINILLMSEATENGIKQLLPKVVSGITQAFSVDNMLDVT